MSENKPFPIMGYHVATHLGSIPWEAIQPHEAQAMRNHGQQTLRRLAERGGLSPCEAVAILEDRDHQRMDWDASVRRLRELVPTMIYEPKGSGAEPTERDRRDGLR